MRHKRPAQINIGIDLDPFVIQEWMDHKYKNDYAAPHDLRIIQGDFLNLIANKDIIDYGGSAKDIFIYCDPPYLLETRSSQRNIYNYEMSRDDHKKLLAFIKTLSCLVMISGYYSELYNNALKDWRIMTFQAQTRGGTATEYLWMNYQEPIRLHDYQYLGENFTDRQRIKRKAERFKNKVMNLPRLERAAILSSIDDIDVF